MKFNPQLVTGIFVGLVVGLHYSAILAAYLPVLTIVALIMILTIAVR